MPHTTEDSRRQSWLQAHKPTSFVRFTAQTLNYYSIYHHWSLFLIYNVTWYTVIEWQEILEFDTLYCESNNRPTVMSRKKIKNRLIFYTTAYHRSYRAELRIKDPSMKNRSLHVWFHGLLKIVTMPGQCVICQVNVPGLGYNWTTFYILAAVTTGWGTNLAHI